MLPYPINVSMWVFISVLLDIVLSIDCCYYQLWLMNCCVWLLSVSKCLLFQAYNFEWFWTHFGWVKHVCVDNLTIIGSDNGLAPTCSRQLAIIWTNAGILLIGPLGINFREIFIKTKHFHSENAFENVFLSAKWQPFVSASKLPPSRLGQCCQMIIAVMYLPVNLFACPLQCNIVSHWLCAYTKWSMLWACLCDNSRSFIRSLWQHQVII